MNVRPLVSVVTPVHNGEAFITECIESILSQTYSNWQYTIVNNCSTDSTLSIANRYAARDLRISVVSNSSFVGSIENHNIALQLISPSSRYCKVVSADDWLFPECIETLVEHAEANPNVGIVNSYQLSGNGRQFRVRWDEIPYPAAVIPGRDICRSHLLGGPYVFGTPTSSLYRADLVRARKAFYPNPLPHADISACYECLQTSDFGFVHQVLSFERIHSEAISSGCKKIRTHESAILRNLLCYGPTYLTRQEYENRLEQVLDAYYRVLAVGFFNGEGRKYWDFHQRDLRELGYNCFGSRLAKAICLKFLDMLLNPKQTIEKLLDRAGTGSNVLILPQRRPGPEGNAGKSLKAESGESLNDLVAPH
jgi:glycosyltransferase involved in cell wall biosynthesis